MNFMNVFQVFDFMKRHLLDTKSL